MMRLRPLSESDLPLVRTWMRDDPQAPAWSEDDLTGLIRAASDNPRKTRRAWVAEDGPALVGFAVATALSIPEAPTECELEFVLVPPHARRRGIGIALMEIVLAWASDLGAKEIWLEVRKSNVHAVRLYERCGFAITGSRPGYYVDPVEDALLMRCQIECA
jgi:ribosomal-protein-alanine N-acetyltransferase